MRLDNSTKRQLNGVSKNEWLKAKTRAAMHKGAATINDSKSNVVAVRVFGSLECPECGAYKDAKMQRCGVCQ